MIVRNKNTNEKLFVISKSNTGDKISYQVLDEVDWIPYILDGNDVDELESDTPPQWVERTVGNSVSKSYPDFLESGFWEEFFDNKPSARKSYEKYIVPTSSVSIDLQDIDNPTQISWGSINCMIVNHLCKTKLAIDIATEKISSSDNEVEIELASLHPSQSSEVQSLLLRLSGSSKISESDIITAAKSWVNRTYSTADMEIFSYRLKKLFANIHTE